MSRKLIGELALATAIISYASAILLARANAARSMPNEANKIKTQTTNQRRA